jgi:phenylacetate-CoA ligase
VYAFLGVTGIRRYQVVQKRLDTFDIMLVRDSHFDESVIELMRHELAKVIGEGVTLNFHYADDLPLTPSGKHRVTVSEVQ